MTSTRLIVDLSEPIDLSLGGGKAVNLSRLTRTGAPVPRGFVATTHAYRLFVGSSPSLSSTIHTALRDVAESRLTSAEGSSVIRAAFAATPMPEQLKEQMQIAYTRLSELGVTRVAVRSSATAEDLAGMSFAGLHDTFLGVKSWSQLLEKTIDCFSSLWTERAVAYRATHAVDNDGVALAVVVQEMVDDIAMAGVMFTVDVMTGARDVISIDATLGLGEALVSGLVNCDHIVVDAKTGVVRSSSIGDKLLKIVVTENGGVEQRATSAEERAKLCLSADAIAQLAKHANKIVETYGGEPQDIEWLVTGAGVVKILQTRAVTTIFPVLQLPARLTRVGHGVALSFASVQGVFGPIKPLARDVWRSAAAAVWHTFTGQRDEQTLIVECGERLWINVTPIMRHPIGRRALAVGLPATFPGLASQVDAILGMVGSDSLLTVATGSYNLATTALGIVPGALASLWAPEAAAAEYEAQLAAMIDTYKRKAQACTTARDRVALISALSDSLETVIRQLPRKIMPSFMCMRALTLMFGNDVEASNLTLQLLRDLPGNVTAEGNEALFAVVEAVRADPETLKLFTETDSAALVGHKLPASVQAALDKFMDKFGCRCAGEIDFSLPRYHEEPEKVFALIKGMLPPSVRSPRDLSAEGVAAAKVALERGCERATASSWFGVTAALKRKMIHALALRLRVLFGKRESHKFALVRILDVARKQMLLLGDELVATGVLKKRDDIFFLHETDLRIALDSTQHDAVRATLARNQEAFAREGQRRQVPAAVSTDGRFVVERFHSGEIVADDKTLVGSGVSLGVHEGTVRVLDHPDPSKIQPGDVLVVRGTDPAWTSLFSVIGALVTEVGGFLTHGSIVSREYGIPCVVGVELATERLKNGQRVRVDGTSGLVQILE